LFILIFVSAMFLFPTHRATAQQTPPHGVPLNTASVVLGETEFDGISTVSAFIPTGSVDPRCLATINENSPGFAPAELVGLVVMCRPREFEGFGKGLGVTIFLPPALIPPPEIFSFDVTIWQFGAIEYGEPASCPGNC
jgi:hypothetical protein